METNGELSYVPERNEQPDDKSTCGKWLQTMQNCINNEIVFKGIKILGFIALLILVMSEYGLDIWTKFQNHATTFITKTNKVENFNTPPITICMGNALKPTVMKKYGVDSILDFAFGTKVVFNMSSVWDVFVEAAYIINRDFKIYAYSLTWGYFQLSKGHKNHSTGYDFNVTEYHTVTVGTCYQINSNYPLRPLIYLALAFNESLSDIDIPKVHLLWLIQKFTIILQKILFKN